MARPLRIDVKDGVYHVTARGWERRVIVDDERDCEDWLRMLDRAAVRSNWRVYAWILMSNHFHLFLRTPEANLSGGMHDLNSGYASLFNRRHRRSGSLFQGRFKAILVENESHAWELSRYVHLNPVRAKMVPTPQTYRWSSYNAYRYARVAHKSPSWLDWETILHEHCNNLRVARRAYCRFVEEGMVEPPLSPLKTAVGGSLLGSSAWVEAMRERLAEETVDANVAQRRWLAWRPKPAEITRVVSRHFSSSIADLRAVHRHANHARIAAVYLIRKLTDESVTALGAQFGGVSAAAISKMVARAESRRKEDSNWDHLLAFLEKQCREGPQAKS